VSPIYSSSDDSTSHSISSLKRQKVSEAEMKFNDEMVRNRLKAMSNRMFESEVTS
jgi:hypothetical protein